MTATPRIIPVVRVSTARQAEQGVSLEAQTERLRQWANLNGYEWSDPVELPGVSGKSRQAEEAVKEAISRLRKNSGDALAAYSLSRMSRSTRNLMEIADAVNKIGCHLVSLTEQLNTGSATGKLVFRILSVLAEFERDIISERTTTALAHKRQNGQKTGGVCPFGWDAKDGKLTENPEEQQTLSGIRELHRTGHSLRHICGWLEQRGIQSKTGGSWHPSTIAGILRREGKT